MRDAHSTFAPENFALPSLGLNGTLTSESACGFLREIRKARGITSCDSRDNFDLGNFKFTWKKLFLFRNHYTTYLTYGIKGTSSGKMKI